MDVVFKLCETENEFDEVFALIGRHRAVWGGNKGFPNLDASFYRKRFESRQILLGVMDGVVVAYYLWTQLMDNIAGSIDMWVHPDYQMQGIRELILDHALDVLRARGITTTEIMLHEDDESGIRMAEARGNVRHRTQTNEAGMVYHAYRRTL